MSEGRDLLISVSSDGTSAGTPTSIELQGDLTINFGNSVQTSVYKNGQNVNHNDAGKSVSLPTALKAPAGTAQNLLLALNESRDESYFWITNETTGGVEFEFAGKVGISNMASPINGDNVIQVEIGVVGDWTRGVAI